MPSRAHALWQMWSDGDFVPSATVTVYEPGTTTPISDTIYANDDPDTSVLPNPFTSDASGFASFFLEDARRVDLHFAKSGFTSQTIPSVDVTFPANRFTFRGAYSAVTAYEPDDVVTYNGATWINLSAATGTTPVEGATWSKMAAAGDLNATIMDAKGDLIVGTAADTASRLAVGAEGTTPFSRAAAPTGIAWEKPNVLIGAKVYRSTTLSVVDDTFTLVTWNATSFANPATLDDSTNGITIDRDGYYHVFGQANWDNNWGSREMILEYGTGSFTRIAAQAYDRDPASTEPYEDSSINASTIHYLSAGDLVRMRVHRKGDNGNPVNLQAGVGLTFLGVHLVGTLP